MERWDWFKNYWQIGWFNNAQWCSKSIKIYQNLQICGSLHLPFLSPALCRCWGAWWTVDVKWKLPWKLSGTQVDSRWGFCLGCTIGANESHTVTPQIPSPGIMVNKGNHPQMALFQVSEILWFIQIFGGAEGATQDANRWGIRRAIHANLGATVLNLCKVTCC